jgi:5'-nucleotidase
VIYHTGDVGGNLSATDESIGADYLASIVENTKQEIPATFLLDSGDSIQGTYFVNSTKGENAIRIMNAAGYDAMAIGNHELDYGIEHLNDLAKEAEFSILGQSYLVEESTDLQTSVLIERGGVTIGIFGLTTPSAKYSSNGGFDQSFGTVSDLIELSVAQAKSLRERGADVVICLSHMGINENQTLDYGSAYDIAENALGIDIIIDGHTPEAELVQQSTFATPIASVSEDGMQVGKIELYMENGVVVPKVFVLTKEDFAQISPVAEVTEVIDKAVAEVETIASTVVGHSPSSVMDYAKEVIRAGESALGNIVTDAMLWATGGDIAFCNSGNIRAGLDEGDITHGEINNMLPYSNFLKMTEVPGSLILSALEHSAALYGKLDGGFLQLGGMSYTFDPSLPEGSRVTQIMVGEEPLNPDLTYDLVVFDFIAEGGDGYDMLPEYFADAPTIGQGDISMVVAEYISQQDTIRTSLQGRITVLDAAKEAPVKNQANTAIYVAILIGVILIAGGLAIGWKHWHKKQSE